MNKRVFIIHGRGSNPDDCWIPWLKSELLKHNFEVFIPLMPDSMNPKINDWVNVLSKNIKKVDRNTYFIGHSVGCQTILRCLQNINSEVGGLIFVGGFFHIASLKNDYEKVLAAPWLENNIDFKHIKKLTNNIIAIFSDNDPHVPISDSRIFKKELNAKIIIEKNKGHFDAESSIKELPVVLNELLKISR